MQTEQDLQPKRWRIKLDREKWPLGHPNGSDAEYFYGVYFPQTDLCIGEMARPGTGVPKGVEWLDEPSPLMKEMMR